MTQAVYVLKSKWSWDNTNHEFATLTIEEWDNDLGEILNLSPESEKRKRMIKILNNLARNQNSSPQDQGSLVRLYRVGSLDHCNYKHFREIKNRIWHHLAFGRIASNM